MNIISLNSRIKASSIVETVIAITIIAICSLVATLVFANVIHSTTPLNKYEFEFELEKIMESTLNNNEITDATYKFEEFTIQKKVEQHSPFHDTYKIAFLITRGKNIYYYELIKYNRD